MSKNFSTVLIRFLVLIVVGIGLIFIFTIFHRAKSARIAALSQVEWEDPLFDFPGLAPTEWTEAVDIIQTANRDILEEVHPQFASYQLYPHNFWQELSNIAQKRDLFLNAPTLLGAFKLLNAQSRALEAYAADLTSFAQLWRITVQESATKVRSDTIFTFIPGVATDIQTMGTALSLLSTNSNAIREDLELRRGCLLFGSCQRLIRTARDVPFTESMTSASEPSLLLPQEIISRSQEYLNATALDDRLFAIETGCFGETDKPSVFLLWQRKYGDGSLAFFPKLATDLFFRSLDGDVRLPQDELLRQEKMGYSWQPETNWYMCPDLSYYPIMATMHELIKKSEKEPLAMSFPDLKEIEDELKQAKVIEPRLIADYIAALQALEKESKEARFRVRIWKTKSGGLIDVVRGLKPETARYIGVTKAIGAPAAPIFTVLPHSYISLFYAPWNPSVWRLDDKPIFTFQDSETRSFVRNYWSLQDKLGEEQIQRIQELSMLGSQRLFVDN